MRVMRKGFEISRRFLMMDSVMRLWLLFLSQKGGSLKIWSALLTLMQEVMVLTGVKVREFSQCDVEAHGFSTGLGFPLWRVCCS